MQNASVSTAVIVNTGAWRSTRTAYIKSRTRVLDGRRARNVGDHTAGIVLDGLPISKRRRLRAARHGRRVTAEAIRGDSSDARPYRLMRRNLKTAISL